MAMTTIRTTTECLQAKHCVSSIDNVWLGNRHNLCRSTGKPTIATSIPFWSRENNFSTLWGYPFPVIFSREGTTGKKVRSINFFVEEGVRELRSRTAPVLFRCFNQSSEAGKIAGQFKSSLIGLPMKPRQRALSKGIHQLRASSSSTPFHLNVCEERLSRHPDLAPKSTLRTDCRGEINFF